MKVLRRLFWSLFAIVAIAVAASGAALALMFHHFSPQPPGRSYPHPSNALQAQQQDLNYFSKLIALDRSFCRRRPEPKQLAASLS